MTSRWLRYFEAIAGLLNATGLHVLHRQIVDLEGLLQHVQLVVDDGREHMLVPVERVPSECGPRWRRK